MVTMKYDLMILFNEFGGIFFIRFLVYNFCITVVVLFFYCLFDFVIDIFHFNCCI